VFAIDGHRSGRAALPDRQPHLDAPAEAPALDVRAYTGFGRPGAHEIGYLAGTKRPQRGQVIQRLEDVRLALSVVTVKNREPRRGIERQLQRFEVPPASRAQAPDPHLENR
jgi:hypothetical protein